MIFSVVTWVGPAQFIYLIRKTNWIIHPMIPFLISDNPLPERVKWPARFFLLTLILLSFGIMLHPLVDPDVFIHLRDGRYWVESGLHIDKDPFTYTAADHPIEKIEWLFRIGIYSAWKIGGYSLLTIIKAVITTIAFLLFGGLIYRRWPNLGVAGSFLGLAVLAAWTRVFPERPQMFTYLLLPWVIHLLEDYRTAKQALTSSEAKKLWLIPLLVIPWANLHPGFIVLFAFLGAHCLDYAWMYLTTRDTQRLHQLGLLCLVAMLSFLAGTIGPAGFSIYSFIAQILGNSDFFKTIVEWMPPEFQRKLVFFLLLGFIWLVQLFIIRQTRLSDFLLLLLFSYLALKSRRNIVLFLLATMPSLAEHLRSLITEWFPDWQISLAVRRKGLIFGTMVMVAILLLTTFTGYAFRLGQFPDYHPTHGLAWIQKHGLQGRLFAPLHWGGYIGWITNNKIKVFMDGRLPTFAGRIYTDYNRIIYGDAAHCLSTLNKYNIQILLVSPKNYFRLFQQLEISGQWALVYWDHVSQVFIRRHGPNQVLAEQMGYKNIDPNATPYFNPHKPERALAEVEREAMYLKPRSF